MHKHRIIKLLSGTELNNRQLIQIRDCICNSENLDLGELLVFAVNCNQFEAAKIIIELGYDLNRESETIAYELLLCSQYNGSDFCVDFYIQQGLIITDDLLTKVIQLAETNPDDFIIEKVVDLVENLRKGYNFY